MEQAIKKYIDYLTYVKHYSQRTISSYYFDLTKLNEYIKNNDISFDELTDKDISLYINGLKANKYSVVSLNRKIVCFRSFYKFYVSNVDSNIINPMLNFSTLKTPKRLPKDLFMEQIRILLTPCEKKENIAIRNQCIIMLLFYCGLRVSECCNLNLLDLDINEHTIRVFGKGNKERSVFFKDTLDKYLIKYLKDIRPFLLIDNKEEALFIGNKGSRITSRAIQYMLKDRANQSKTPFKVTPHMLRHTFATNLLNNDVDLKILQELLGHASLSTTQIYTHVSKARLKKVYDSTHPMAKKLNELKEGK